MSSIPYDLKKRICAIFGFPFSFFDRLLLEVLLKVDGLGLLVSFCFAGENGARPKLNPLAVYWVLKHIAMQTLPFGQVLEFIRVNDILRGNPVKGIAGASISERLVKQILMSLSYSGWLIKIKFNRDIAVTPLYGLDFPIICKTLYNNWGESIFEKTNCAKDKASSMVALRAQKLLGLGIYYLERFQPMLDYLRRQKVEVKSVENFCKELEELQLAPLELSEHNYDLSEKIKQCRVRQSELMPNKWRFPQEDFLTKPEDWSRVVFAPHEE